MQRYYYLLPSSKSLSNSGVLLSRSNHLSKLYADPSRSWHDACYYLLCSARRILISHVLRGRSIILIFARRTYDPYIREAYLCSMCPRGGTLSLIFYEAGLYPLCSLRRIAYMILLFIPSLDSLLEVSHPSRSWVPRGGCLPASPPLISRCLTTINVAL